MIKINRQNCVIAAILFIMLEALLASFIDRPLSEYLREVDKEHTGFINIFRAYTDLGKAVWYLMPSGIGLLVCLAGVRLKQIAAPVKEKMRYALPRLGYFFACVAISGIVTNILKSAIGRARPVLLDRHGIYGFDPLAFHSAHESYNSMPSGHSTTAFAVAVALYYLWPRGKVLFASCAVILVLSRIMVNAHYLSDVLAGGVVGTLTAVMLRRLLLDYGIFPIDDSKTRR